MASSTDDLTANIREQFLLCKICLDDLKYPKTLPCLHTFCAQCLHYYIEHNNIDGRKFTCPVCRRQIYIPKNGVEGFPDSFFVCSLEDMVTRNQEERNCGICKFRNEIKRSANLCVECKIQLCEGCSDSHQAAKITEGHTMLPVSTGPQDDDRENYCRVHRGETIKYYCETCNSPICLPCTFLDHKAHQIEEIKNVRDTFNQDMAGLVMQSKDNIIQLAQSKADLVELENELFIRKEHAKTGVRRAVQELMKSLNEQEAQLMNELDDFFDIVTVSRDRQKLERTIFRLERAHDFAEQLLSSDTSPIAQIVNRAEAKDSLHQALNYELPDPTIHARKLLQNTVFLSGYHDFQVGTLLKCSDGGSNVVSTLRPLLPSTKAVYMQSLKLEGNTNMGEVLAVAFLPSGNPVVLTSTGQKVNVFTKRGNLKFNFGSDEELQHPSDLTVTRQGCIAVTDCGFLSVKVFDQIGTLRTEFGSGDVFQLPIALTTDQFGRFVVCDQIKQRITVHKETGDLLQTLDVPEVAMPQFLCFHANRLYVCDGENKEIVVYKYENSSAPTLHFVTKLAAPENHGYNSCHLMTRQNEQNQELNPAESNSDIRLHTDGHFLDCSSICTDCHGNLFITDARLDKIHALNERGEMSNLIPMGRQIRRPTCISVSTEGIMAVAQQGTDPMDHDITSLNQVLLYKVMRADV